MPFRPYEEVAGDPAIELPFRGTTYRILPPNAAVALRLSAHAAVAMAAKAGLDVPEEAMELLIIPDEEEHDFARDVLGDAYERMLAELSWDEVKAAVDTCFIGWVYSKELAEAHWDGMGKEQAAKATAKARRTATRTPSAAASTTPSSASPSGTTRRKKAAKASRSRGSSRSTGT